MSIEPKRRFWQLHLSTVVLVAIAAGGLMWLNFECEPVRDKDPTTIWGYSYGWPLSFIWIMSKETIDMYNAVSKEYGSPTRFTSAPKVNSPSLLIDLGARVGLIAFLAFVAEYRIRRREARKP